VRSCGAALEGLRYALMSIYRLYALKLGVVEDVAIVALDDDEAAIEYFKDWVKGCKAELWESNRLVIRIDDDSG